jgi:hypothetical protein
MLNEFFDGDDRKIWAWMVTPNPITGGYSPSYMLLVGRGEKLYKLIDNLLKENER